MMPISFSRKITVFQRIGTKTRTEAHRSIVAQARRKQNRATAEQHLNQLAKIKAIKREADREYAEYLENKRLTYNLPNTPLAHFLLRTFKPLKTTTNRTIWLQLYAPVQHYPADLQTVTITRTLWT